MKIRYLSDLHLDHSNLKLEPSDADVLVLAGDISSSPLFVAEWLGKNVDKDLPVVYVPGNHEYDHRDIAIQDHNIISALRDLENVHFLNNKSIEINGVKFIGSTLWTGFDAFPEMGAVSDLKSISQKSVCDFQVIYKNDKPFCPDDAEELHKKSKSFIFGELSNPYEGKRVVVSHFPPSRVSLHKLYRGNILNPYFVSNAEDLVVKSDLWIHGHLHSSVNKSYGGVKILCNPRGYSQVYNLSENPAWDQKKIIRI